MALKTAKPKRVKAALRAALTLLGFMWLQLYKQKADYNSLALLFLRLKFAWLS